MKLKEARILLRSGKATVDILRLLDAALAVDDALCETEKRLLELLANLEVASYPYSQFEKYRTKSE